MISLGECWAILGTTVLALALEAIWFSGLWLGSWLDGDGKKDRFEDFTLRRLTLTFFIYLTLAITLAYSLTAVKAELQSLKYFILPVVALVGVGSLISALRLQHSFKHMLAELSFVLVLLTICSYVLYLWPW
jgi:hypothetical protein